MKFDSFLKFELGYFWTVTKKNNVLHFRHPSASYSYLILSTINSESGTNVLDTFD